MKNPDFYYKTGELTDSTLYSCWVIKELDTTNLRDVAAALIQIRPHFFSDAALKELIFATAPARGFRFSAPMFPEWVTLYKVIKGTPEEGIHNRKQLMIVDKGMIYRTPNDVPTS